MHNETSIFLPNRYTTTYFKLISGARYRKDILQYTEAHHIIPSSLGGGDEQTNLVRLTAKEHFVCHHLLTKMCKDEEHSHRMWTAFFLMHINRKRRYFTARTYQLSKIKMSEAKKRLVGDRNPYFGKKHSAKTRAKMSLNWNNNVIRNHDNTIYEFYHDKYGNVKSTQRELYLNYSLCNKQLSSLVRGKTGSHRGWRIRGDKDVSNISRDLTINPRDIHG